MKYSYRLLFLGLLMVVILLASGCVDNTASTNTKTSGVWASFKVSLLDDGSVKASATLTVGGSLGTDLNLSSGETIYCNDVVLYKVQDLFGIHYETTLPVQANKYIFKFQRIDEIVTTEVGAIPAIPTIITPTSLSIVNSGQSLKVQWDTTHPGQEINIEAKADAFGSLSVIGSIDDGSYIIPASSIAAGPTTPQGNCNMSLTVTRVNKFYVNQAYQGGTGRSEASTSITMTYCNPYAPEN